MPIWLRFSSTSSIFRCNKGWALYTNHSCGEMIISFFSVDIIRETLRIQRPKWAKLQSPRSSRFSLTFRCHHSYLRRQRLYCHQQRRPSENRFGAEFHSCEGMLMSFRPEHKKSMLRLINRGINLVFIRSSQCNRSNMYIICLC